MGLLTRLVDPQEGEERIPIHQFMAALAEYGRNAPGVNLNSISNAFGLSAQEETALANFIGNLNSNMINRALIHDVLMLGEGHIYTVQNVRDRLQITVVEQS